MTFDALPYDNKAKKEPDLSPRQGAGLTWPVPQDALASEYGIRGIPCLVVLKATTHSLTPS